MRQISIEILGNPMPKQSARFRSVKVGERSFIKSYQKKEVVTKERNIAAIVQAQLGTDFKPFDCAVAMTIDFVFPMLSTMPVKAKKMIEDGMIVYKDKKPDVENLIKLLNDALEGVVFLNDSQVCELMVSKYFGRVPKTVIKVIELI